MCSGKKGLSNSKGNKAIYLAQKCNFKSFRGRVKYGAKNAHKFPVLCTEGKIIFSVLSYFSWV